MDLTKASFHAYNPCDGACDGASMHTTLVMGLVTGSNNNSKSHFLLLHNRCANKQFWQLLVLKVTQAALAVACFRGLSDINRFLDGL